MNWIFGILGIVALGAVVLAIYERHKNRRITFDDVPAPPHDRQRAAYSKAEHARAEGIALQNPGSGMP